MIFGTHTPLTLPELDRPAAAKTGTTDDNRDTWTMGYTTDLAVGVWVGNTDNSPTRNLDGVQSAAPIWHDFMVKVHQDPEMSKTLLGPDDQPIPDDFPKPDNIYEGPICAATGKLPIPGARTVTEVLVKGEGPKLKCNQVTDDEKKDLQAALADAAKNPHFTASGIKSLQEYASMVNVSNQEFNRLTTTPTPEPQVSPTPSETPGGQPGTQGQPTPTPGSGTQGQPTPTPGPPGQPTPTPSGGNPTPVPKPTPTPVQVPTQPAVPPTPTPSADAGSGPLMADEPWHATGYG